MAEKVTAWRGADGQLYETEEAAKSAGLRAAADFIARTTGEHLVNVCTGKTVCERTADYLTLLSRELRAARERAAKVQA